MTELNSPQTQICFHIPLGCLLHFTLLATGLVMLFLLISRDLTVA